MTLHEEKLAKKVLDKLKKHKDKLQTYQGENRWDQYKEAILNDKYSMKLQYSDSGEIYNISLTAEDKTLIHTLNIDNNNISFNDCLDTARNLFGENFSQKLLYI